MGRRLIEVSDGDLERLSQDLLNLNELASGGSNDDEISALWGWVEYACYVLGVQVPDED